MEHSSAHPELAFASATEIARRTRSGELSAIDVTRFFLARIEAINPSLNAFTRVLHNEAIAAAHALDLLPAEERGPLHGVPVGIKAEIKVRGTVTHYGSAAYITPSRRDAEVVRRLRDAGAIIIGQTAMPEFGIWPFTESAAYGLTRNPWSLDHSPAGSSGGSAAAVASGMVPVAMGGDGGGSIRLPAAWCGLFGLKPQRGRVTTAPDTNLWGALGTLGPLTRTVEDSRLVYDVIAGPTSGVDEFTAGAYVAPKDGPLRIAWSTTGPLFSRADRETRRAVEETARMLEELGHSVTRIDFSYPRALSTAFVPQYLDGFGSSAARAERPSMVESRTRHARWIGAITRLSAPRTVRAARERGAQVAREINAELFERPGAFDLFLTPVAPHSALKIGQLDGLGYLRAAWKANRVAGFTTPWNVTGNPAASVPAGFDANGLPVGVQIVGPPNGEQLIFQAAAQLQEARAWNEAYPRVAE
ncbi:amidase family protein [Corynebacterium sp.]|uniref:amidase family protein n=1 Tax=Corynebacterium sp. TaxID=1720 RepID=UPI002A91BF3A|nr:amidase family protein [Corynebacterium sp.]MDY5786069.1 amidase family protein [Corynebacterium sp.]